MHPQLAHHVWDYIVESHKPITQRFYDHLFADYPQYHAIFDQMGESYCRRFVGTLGIAARAIDDTETVHPHLMRIGKQFASFNLKKEDLVNFQHAFIKALAECCAERWTPECEKTWNELFEHHLIPYLNHGVMQ